MPGTFARAAWLTWTVALALCLSVALVSIEAWQMWQLREASLRSAKLVTASLAESISQQVETTLKTADTVVATLVQRAEVDGVDPASLQRLYGLMTSLAAALPAIHEMGLTDKDGNAIVKSLVAHPAGLNYSERDYFRYLSSHDTRDVFIGTPVRSKIDGSLNITVSRRLNARDGSFAGIVVTSVSMEFFRKLSALKPDMRLGHALLAELIAAGEVPVGLTVYSGNADSVKKKGAPVEWVAVEPIVGRPQAVSVAAKAPHPNAALLFNDFLLSPDGQKLLNELDRNPASKSQTTLLTKYKYSMVDPIKWLDESAKWEKLWKELFLPVR